MASLDIETILRRSGVGTDPAYYAGRAATLSDLDGVKLEKVFRGVVALAGDDAGGALLEVVGQLPDLSASRFIHSVRQLASSGWSQNGVEGSSFSHQQCIQDEGSAFGAIQSILCLNSGDDTQIIRADFREVHEAMLEASKPIDKDNWLLVGRQ